MTKCYAEQLKRLSFITWTLLSWNFTINEHWCRCFHLPCPYDIETSQLICRVNQWTGFYMATDPHHERVIIKLLSLPRWMTQHFTGTFHCAKNPVTALQVLFCSFYEIFENSYSAEHLWLKNCVKSVRIQSFSNPYFTAFGMNTEINRVKLRIQYECGKIRTRKSPNTDSFNIVNSSVSWIKVLTTGQHVSITA